MNQYLLESKHTKENCLQALDEMMEKDNQLLEKTWFGCMSGDHTGWTTVKAENDHMAKEMLPMSLQSKAQVIKVDMFTPKQVKAFHESM